MKVGDIIYQGTRISALVEYTAGIEYLNQKFETFDESRLKAWLTTHGTLLNQEQEQEVYRDVLSKKIAVKEGTHPAMVVFEIEEVLQMLADHFGLEDKRIKEV